MQSSVYTDSLIYHRSWKMIIRLPNLTSKLDSSSLTMYNTRTLAFVHVQITQS